MSKADAQKKYIAKVHELAKTYGTNWGDVSEQLHRSSSFLLVTLKVKLISQPFWLFLPYFIHSFFPCRVININNFIDSMFDYTYYHWQYWNAVEWHLFFILRVFVTKPVFSISIWLKSVQSKGRKKSQWSDIKSTAVCLLNLHTYISCCCCLFLWVNYNKIAHCKPTVTGS